MSALWCHLLLFNALTRPNQKKITERSQGDKKNALPPHHAARLKPTLQIMSNYLAQK
jgi:hypothetical protein